MAADGRLAHTIHKDGRRPQKGEQIEAGRLHAVVDQTQERRATLSMDGVARQWQRHVGALDVHATKRRSCAP